MDWRVADIAELIDGASWRVPPEAGLRVLGASIYAPTLRADDMVFVRDAQGDFGITPGKLSAQGRLALLAIVSPTAADLPQARAVLQVPDQQKALFALASAARARLVAPVVGVTGSAGKTSVTAMIAHCLQGAGPVYATRFGANMARGISWNLCCVPESVAYCVLEMAIRQMLWNSRLARPDVSVFTNIHLAHLVYHKDLRTIAARKSQIFSAMSPGAVAVVNADMHESATVQAAALAQGLRLLTYGQAACTDIRPIPATGAPGTVTLDIHGHRMTVPTVGSGPHAIENAMAIAGVLCALNQPVDVLMVRLASFEALAGRGMVVQVAVKGGSAQILDHSYNANPASMRAALDELGRLPCTGRRIAVLGQMAELGAHSAEQHGLLVRDLKDRPLDRIYLIGEGYDSCSQAVSKDTRIVRMEMVDLQRQFEALLKAGDVVMLKGSNSTGLYRFADRFRQN